MKTLMFAVLAATVAISPIAITAAEAQPGQRNGHGAQARGRGHDAQARRNWRKGERFDQRYAQNYQVVDYRRYRGLRAPPRGYRYVRSGNDAVLVGITSGIIASVIAGAIR